MALTLRMVGGKCGCSFCKEGVLNPNWQGRKNKRGDAFGSGSGAKKKGAPQR